MHVAVIHDAHGTVIVDSPILDYCSLSPWIILYTTDTRSLLYSIASLAHPFLRLQCIVRDNIYSEKTIRLSDLKLNVSEEIRRATPRISDNVGEST